MPERDTVDFVTAFAAGAVLGAAAAMLLMPEPPTAAQRIRRDFQPYGRRLRKDAHRARKGFGEGVEAAADAGSVLREAGRDLVAELRREMQDIVASARVEIERTMEEQVDRARKSLRKSARRLRKA